MATATPTLAPFVEARSRDLPQDGWWSQTLQWLEAHPTLGQLVGVAALLVVALFVLFVARGLAVPFLKRAIEKSRFEWDDAFVKSGSFRWLSGILPLLVLWAGADLLKEHLDLEPTAHTVIKNVAEAAMIVCGMLAAKALLNALHTIYARRPGAANKPIKGYVELAKIFLVVIGSLLAIAALLGLEVGALLAGVGAMTAVLLLIFKDTILSAVASVQLTNQDMIRIGDWIEMPSVGADGDVVDIALHTVKVQNWDKTIATIPTYQLVSSTFKNWRGMAESGGRRIKRNLLIDMSTVRFLDDAEVEAFAGVGLLRDYIAEKQSALHAANADADGPVTNRRRLTNLGTFRAYVARYLQSLPQVHDDMTFLVRQLQPTPQGLPLEIYLFTRTTKWSEYEAIQSDIFDHLLAVMPEFGLRVFQSPTGHDVARALADAGAAAEAGAGDE